MLLIDMYMIYFRTTSYTARFTVLLVTAMRTKTKKYFLTPTILLFHIT
jgi:hypothetical protein